MHELPDSAWIWKVKVSCCISISAFPSLMSSIKPASNMFNWLEDTIAKTSIVDSSAAYTAALCIGWRVLERVMAVYWQEPTQQSPFGHKAEEDGCWWIYIYTQHNSTMKCVRVCDWMSMTSMYQLWWLKLTHGLVIQLCKTKRASGTDRCFLWVRPKLMWPKCACAMFVCARIPLQRLQPLLVSWRHYL